MKRRHFETLQPLCPLCRTHRQIEARLEIAAVAQEREGAIDQGILRCTSPTCGMEYPILDGIPIIVSDVPKYVADNLHHLSARDDLTPLLEGLLGDAAGPGTYFDVTRQHISSYAWDHWGDLDPEEPQDGPIQPGAMGRCLRAGLDLVGTRSKGPLLDVGASVGRSTFELAAQTDGLVLGIDLHFAMLRVAARVAREGVVQYPRRRIGVVFDRREFPVDLPGRDRVDFWCCDAMALPFADATFGLAAAMNVFDCTPSPAAFVGGLVRALSPGGHLVLSTPYDWSSAVTQPVAWVGGHSQRGAFGGAAEPIMRALLTPGQHPMGAPDVQIVGEVERFPWQVRLHDRSANLYQSHLVVAQRTEPAGSGGSQ